MVYDYLPLDQHSKKPLYQQQMCIRDRLNIMHLASPYSAILSALIFNAIIIPCLIPLAMKGVKYKPMSSGKLLARNMLIYGVGGIITPFIGIKIIDLIIHPLLTLIGL